MRGLAGAGREGTWCAGAAGKAMRPDTICAARRALEGVQAARALAAAHSSARPCRTCKCAFGVAACSSQLWPTLKMHGPPYRCMAHLKDACRASTWIPIGTSQIQTQLLMFLASRLRCSLVTDQEYMPALPMLRCSKHTLGSSEQNHLHTCILAGTLFCACTHARPQQARACACTSRIL